MEEKSHNHKIGFCFLIYKNLSQHKTWLSFFKGVDKSRYGIYCHPKKPRSASRQSLLSGNIIDNLVETGWAKPSLVQASLNLFQAAIDDGCDQVVLLSGSCIPIHSFNYISSKLSCGKSFLHFCPDAKQSGYFDITETKRRYRISKHIKDFIEFKDFIKSEQWLSLSKYDCQKVLEDNSLDFFTDVFAADEHYIPTVLNKHGLLDSIENQQITFTDWNNNIDWRHPVKFKKLREEHIAIARENGCLFLRKAGSFCRSLKALETYGQSNFHIPSNKNYIAFVHIPKNGGCSVKSLLNKDGRFLNYSHKSASEIKKDLGDDLWNECYTFTIVRNPWARVFSAFSFFKNGGLPQYNDHLKAEAVGIYPDTDFNEWILENKDNFLNCKFPFAGTPVWMHFKKQVQYFDEHLDAVIKLEEIDRHPLLENVPHENSSNSLNYIAVYNTSSIDIIEEAYKEDIIAFDYRFNN